ncbi:MAG: hypothetical protein LUE11_10450 [Clostridia bacterium]|nr:hypothetical protein [Clostridia bacterium]
MDNIKEIRRIKVCCWVDATTIHEHIGNTVIHQLMKYRQAFLFIQLLQQTSFHAVNQLIIVAVEVVHNQILCALQQNVTELITRNLAKAINELLSDRLLISFRHLPDGYRTRIPSFMGIRNIKIVFQVISMSIVRQNRNAFASGIHPAVKFSIPCFQCRDRSCIRTLGIDQQLFVKTALVIPAGSR